MTGQETEATTPEPNGSPPSPRMPAATVRHVYVAAAAVIAVVALIAAAFNGSSSAGSKQSSAPTGKKATQYYKRLVTIGRGLIPTPIGEALLPALPAGVSTLTDGTEFRLSTDGWTKVTFVKVTILPGASIPWHHHTTPQLIDLIAGKVVDYRAERPGCAGKVLPTGRAEFEPNTQVHTLTNPFKVPAELYVVTWSPANADPALIQVDAPPGCPKNP